MIHLVGYGNPARGDDGLGPAFAAWAETAAFPGLTVRERFQLGVDEALWIRYATRVVFVDATLAGPGPYRFREARPDTAHGLSTHAATPETVLALSKALYQAAPPAFVLEITGTAFGTIREGLSDDAARNLEAAKTFFARWMADQGTPQAV